MIKISVDITEDEYSRHKNVKMDMLNNQMTLYKISI